MYQGDHVLTFNWAKVNKGDVVVFKYEKTFFIKRILEANNRFTVEGDNKELTSKIGHLDSNQIIGKVIAKY